jgi:hypothetical protein
VSEDDDALGLIDDGDVVVLIDHREVEGRVGVVVPADVVAVGHADLDREGVARAPDEDGA